ncbi:putative AMMECR1 domain-containing protein [Plasmopara halstedii]
MASAAMVVYCFDTLQSHFNGSTEPKPFFDVQQEYPLFVTWEVEEQGRIQLRGCIGTLAPTRLQNLRDFTFKSALHDRRFDPIGPQELNRLLCSVSLLIDYNDAKSYDDWVVILLFYNRFIVLLCKLTGSCAHFHEQIGTHGIIIKFNDSDGNTYSATYLPQVAREQGWTHVETITSLMRKAGYRCTVSEDMLKTVKVTRYRTSIHKLTYQQYLSVKQEICDYA